MTNLIFLPLKLFSHLIISLPLPAQFFIGDLIGYLWFDILRIRRTTVLHNLDLAFPEKAEAEKIRIGRRSMCNLGRGFVEFLRLPFIDEYPLENHFEIVGESHLLAAMQEAKGVALLTCHLGNGDWATVGLQKHGFPLNIISKEFKLRFLNDFWFETRMAIGTRFIKDRGSSLQILKALKANRIVVFMLDQFMGPPIGVKTRFFGHETGTAMGLAVLVARSRSPVVPVFTYRLSDGRTRIVFEPQIPFVEGKDSEQTIQSMTQTYSDKIEDIVRRYPEQWMWVHRRWKKFKY